MRDLCILLAAALGVGLSMLLVNLKAGGSPTLKRLSYYAMIGAFVLAGVALVRMALVAL